MNIPKASQQDVQKFEEYWECTEVEKIWETYLGQLQQ